MVKTAVIGASGYIGRHLWKTYRRAHPDSLGTSFSATNAELVYFDIRRPDIQPLRLEQSAYRAVLIASAIPNIAFCEQQRDAAYEVNVRGTLELIRQLGRTQIQVIFLSSDYVFEGNTGRYTDEAEMRPTTEYGRQKALVEKELPSLARNPLILRLSKIYGVEKGDRTFLDEIACCLAKGAEVRASTDQVFCPTYIDDLVRAIVAIQDRGLCGVLNVCNAECWSRYDLAVNVAKALSIAPQMVQPVLLHELPGMSGRPLNTSMTCDRLTREVGFLFTPLSDAFRAVAANWK